MKEWLNRVHCTDALHGLRQLEEGVVDLLVTDPPYGYSFMGKSWDKGVPKTDIWKECLRVLKPGSFAFIMSAPRQDVQAQMIMNLKEAGFVMAFTPLYHAYASGFPKATNISKSVDKRGGRPPEEFKAFASYIKEKREESGLSMKDISQHFPSKTGGLTGCVWNWENGANVPTKKQMIILRDKLKLDNRFDELIERVEAEREIQGTDKNWGKKGSTPFVNYGEFDIKNKPATPEAQSLDGAYAGFQPKPATEIIIRAQKPEDIYTKLTIITSQTIKLLQDVEKWTNVNSVEKSLRQAKTLREYIAQGNATEKIIQEATVNIGRVAKHNGLMDMLKSTLEELMEKQDTNWSIGLLWRSILVESLSKANKYTTKMVKEQIIELRTLNLLIYQSIQESIITQEKTKQNGLKLNVIIVEDIILSVLTRLQSLREISVQKTVSTNTFVVSLKLSAKNVQENLRLEVSGLLEKESIAHKNVIKKPEVSVVLVAMKPLSEKTYVDQALQNGKGITWLDDCRIPTEGESEINFRENAKNHNLSATSMWNPEGINEVRNDFAFKGRFPANLLVSDDVLNDGTITKGLYRPNCVGKKYGETEALFAGGEKNEANCLYNDSGSFSRYFDLDKWFINKLPRSVQETFPFLIVAKAAKSEKNKGLTGFEEEQVNDGRSVPPDNAFQRGKTLRKNVHPTVKPLKLMSYLITLGSREHDVVLDPFLGSGTTAIAARQLTRKFIGFEINKEYHAIAEARIKRYMEQTKLHEVLND